MEDIDQCPEDIDAEMEQRSGAVNEVSKASPSRGRKRKNFSPEEDQKLLQVCSCLV